MSWLFSQALVAACWDHTCSDGEPCAQLNVMPTPQPFWRNDKTTDICRLSRSGLTCAVLTAELGAALLTSFLVAFPVRTSASPEMATGSMASDPDCGVSLPGLLARFDRDSHSLKTAQRSLFEDSTECYATLPRSGSMRNGAVYLRPSLAPLTKETASGFWPTPTVGGRGTTLPEGTTPTGMMPDGRKRTVSLAAYVAHVERRMFPTPTATAYKGWSKNHNRANTNDRIDYTIEREAYEAGQSGRLNPDWCEWLMGWPIGWTALKPLGTDRFQEWQQAHSCNSPSEVD